MLSVEVRWLPVGVNPVGLSVMLRDSILQGGKLVLIILLLLAFALIIWLEAPGLVKKKMWRELVAFSVFLAIGATLAIPQVYGIRPFEPNAPIEAMFKPMAEWLKKP